MSDLEKARGYAIDALTRYIIDNVKTETTLDSKRQHDLEQSVAKSIESFADLQTRLVVGGRLIEDRIDAFDTRLTNLEKDSHPYIKTWPADEIDKAIMGLKAEVRRLTVRLEALENTSERPG